MIDIQAWLQSYLQALNEHFPNRIWFVGLQGSYARGEANAESDIDIVAILDELTAADIQCYDTMLDTLPHRALICGFLSGKEEILNWEPADLFQFYYDTTPIIGSLDDLLSLIDDAAINRSIKTAVGNIYHGCVHNLLFEKSEDILRSLYKSASFALQAIAFKNTGRYYTLQKELLHILSLEDRKILETAIQLKHRAPVNFQSMSDDLFYFCKRWLSKT